MRDPTYHGAGRFGGGVTISDGIIDTQIGMAFSGATTGGTFGASSPGSTNQTAVIRNRIGTGYPALDGYGFINVQNAVGLPLR